MHHLKPPSVGHIEDEKLCRVTKISTLPKFERIVAENDLLDETVVIRAKPLTLEGVIGNPEGGDFPIMPCHAGSGIDGSLLAIHY